MSFDNILTGLGATGPAMFVVALAAAYLACQLRLQLTDRSWSGWRSLSFAGGCLLMAFALAPAFTQWAHEDLQGQVLQHLVLGMLAPVALVLGAPVSLALLALPRWGARLITRMLGTPWLRWVAHPVGALALSFGATYLLYLTPLYAVALESRFVQGLLHFHFLLAGFLFSWSVLAGFDRRPRRPSVRMRVAVLFAVIVLYAILTKLMVLWQLPVGAEHPPEMVASAARLMLYGGNLSALLLAAILFGSWLYPRNRPGRTVPDRSVTGEPRS